MTATVMAETGVATASEPHARFHPHGRSADFVDGAAAARTAELFSTYGRTVRGLCRALLRDHAEAEDAAQQTFLSAHRAILNGTDPREPAAWLATIARNECWGRIRSRMREPLPSETVETAAAHDGDPLAEAIRRADLAALWRAIESLPRQQRDALLLREFGGLSYGELAAALAVSTPAVESLLFRARARLRAAYASVTGAAWLDSLVRLLAGGGAPVAAKVAVIGVGAAAVTGGAVVGPQLVHHAPKRTQAPAHRRHEPPIARTTVPVIAPAVVASLPPARIPTRRVSPAPAPRPVAHEREHSDDRARTTTTSTQSREGRDDGGDSTAGGSGGPGPSSTSGDSSHDGHGGGDGAATAPQTIVTVDTSGSTSGPTSGRDGGGGDGDGDRGGGDGGSGSSGRGGDGSGSP